MINWTKFPNILSADAFEAALAVAYERPIALNEMCYAVAFFEARLLFETGSISDLASLLQNGCAGFKTREDIDRYFQQQAKHTGFSAEEEPEQHERALFKTSLKYHVHINAHMLFSGCADAEDLLDQMTDDSEEE